MKKFFTELASLVMCGIAVFLIGGVCYIFWIADHTRYVHCS